MASFIFFYKYSLTPFETLPLLFGFIHKQLKQNFTMGTLDLLINSKQNRTKNYPDEKENLSSFHYKE